MKFFIVVLAVIGIESIGNYLGEVNASDSYKYDFDVFRDEMSESPNPYIQLPGPELMDRSAQIIIKREIAGDELTFFMTLKRDNEVDYVIPSDDRVSLCDERPLAQLMRGMLVATVQDTSCPIEKGEYYISNNQRLSFTSPVQFKCGQYTGSANIVTNDMHVLEVAFNYELTRTYDDCKEA